jgi:hypothetical protein
MDKNDFEKKDAIVEAAFRAFMRESYSVELSELSDEAIRVYLSLFLGGMHFMLEQIMLKKSREQAQTLQ